VSLETTRVKRITCCRLLVSFLAVPFLAGCGGTRPTEISVSTGSPSPTLTGLLPSLLILDPNAGSGASARQIVVQGQGFVPGSVVTADDQPVPTTFLTPNTLQAQFSGLSLPKQINIAVVTPSPGGGKTTSLPLTVIATGVVSASQHPQVAQYSLASPAPASMAVEFGLDQNYGLRTWAQPIQSGGGTLDMLIAGMRAFTTYHMRAILTLQDGTTVVDSDHTFTTSGLPADRLPQLSVTRSGTIAPNPGVELFNFTDNFNPARVKATATDLKGSLIWYYDFDPDGSVGGVPFPIKLLSNGHMFLIVGHNRENFIREVDLAGRTIRQLTMTDFNSRMASAGFPISALEFHHDFMELRNGHFLVIINFTKNVPDPSQPSGSILLQGDGVVDLDQNLNPVWLWSSFDHLDVNRRTKLFGPVFNFPGQYDWTHANALVYLPDDGNFLISLRNQSWVVKIDYRDGKGNGNVIWRLGEDGDFALQNGGPSDWFYGQHFPALVSQSSTNPTLTVFDNGNFRPLPDGTPCNPSLGLACYSRVPMLQLDEQRMQATIIGEDKLSAYSFFGGDAQFFPSGNTEYTLAITSALNGPTGASRVVEVGPGPQFQPVWQIDVDGQLTYRANRIPSLYPGVTW
jgi:arylsulfate sulfotransferase